MDLICNILALVQVYRFLMFFNQNNKLIFETQNIEWMEGYIDF